MSVDFHRIIRRYITEKIIIESLTLMAKYKLQVLETNFVVILKKNEARKRCILKFSGEFIYSSFVLVLVWR
jgi:hypothetical protein